MIYDCFTFFDEIDLLELRLRTLEDVVDRFVIVEADVTFQGATKPLHYGANAARFARWSDKIIHVPVTDVPDAETAWDREYYQRRAILRGLGEAADDDLIVVADVDEIPRPEALARLAREVVSPVALRMEMYYYFANVLITRTWDRARAARRRDLRDAQALRDAKGLPGRLALLVFHGPGRHPAKADLVLARRIRQRSLLVTSAHRTVDEARDSALRWGLERGGSGWGSATRADG